MDGRIAHLRSHYRLAGAQAGVRSGFADGCEARLCLAVQSLVFFGLCPSFGLWPKT
jgi:hypothetical protein